MPSLNVRAGVPKSKRTKLSRDPDREHHIFFKITGPAYSRDLAVPGRPGVVPVRYDDALKPGQTEGLKGTLSLARENINYSIEALSRVDQYKKPVLDPETTRQIKKDFKIDDKEFDKNQNFYIGLVRDKFKYLKSLLDTPGTQMRMSKNLSVDPKGKISTSAKGPEEYRVDGTSYFNKEGNLTVHLTDENALDPRQGASVFVGSMALHAARLSEREGYGLPEESKAAICNPASFSAFADGIRESRERQAEVRTEAMNRRDAAASIAKEIIDLRNAKLDPAGYEKAQARIMGQMEKSFSKELADPGREQTIRDGLASLSQKYNNLSAAELKAQADALLGGPRAPSGLGEGKEEKPLLTRQDSVQTSKSNSSPPPYVQTAHVNAEELKQNIQTLKDNLDNFTHDDFKAVYKDLNGIIDEAYEKGGLSPEACEEAYKELKALKRQKNEPLSAKSPSSVRSNGSDDEFASGDNGKLEKFEKDLEWTPKRPKQRTVEDLESSAETREQTESTEPEPPSRRRESSSVRSSGSDYELYSDDGESEKDLDWSPRRPKQRTVEDLESSADTLEHESTDGRARPSRRESGLERA